MWSQQIEIILARQLASYLSMPIFLVDTEGNLVFYNEAAEGLLGMRFEETGEMTAAEWSTRFQAVDDVGKALPTEELPLIHTLEQQTPAHKSFSIHAADGEVRQLNVTTFPLVGISARFVGAVAIFWEQNGYD